MIDSFICLLILCQIRGDWMTAIVWNVTEFLLCLLVDIFLLWKPNFLNMQIPGTGWTDSSSWSLGVMCCFTINDRLQLLIQSSGSQLRCILSSGGTDSNVWRHLACHNLKWGCYWHLTRDAAKHPTIQREALATKTYIAQNTNPSGVDLENIAHLGGCSPSLQVSSSWHFSCAFQR